MARATKINLNTATLEELAHLPGIGERTAQKIIDYRDENGPFESLEDLEEVPGLSRTLIEKLRDEGVTLEEGERGRAQGKEEQGSAGGREGKERIQDKGERGKGQGR